jgi:hypothetical protein
MVTLLTSSKHVGRILSCRIRHANLRDNSYCTLSYTWGDPVFTKTLVVDDNSCILITENLDMALRRFRLASIRFLWADAACIDQHNVQERAEQVRLMGQIFGQAEKVLIWTELDNASRDG